MRIFIVMLTLFLVAEATAQEPPQLWDKVQDALSKFVPDGQPLERPIEQSADTAAPGESPQTQRQATWDAATKLTSAETPPTGASPHAKNECLDPTKFQPNQVGYLDYYLFKVVDTGPYEVYLLGEGDQGPTPICLTHVDSEDLQESQLVVILGNVMVRGTKAYKNEKGDELTVRVVKLLSPEESEFADAQRAIIEKENPLRTWTSKDGKHKVEARFRKFAGGKVHLVNKEGKNITVSPSDLTQEDRQYYRDLVKQARDAARKATDPDDAEEHLDPYR